MMVSYHRHHNYGFLRAAAKYGMSATISGTLRDIEYTAANQWRVLSVETTSGEAVCAVGIHPNALIGEKLKLVGSWSDHPDWARRFIFERVHVLDPPPDSEQITNYIASNADIDLSAAAKIVNHFGDRSLEVLNRYPDELYQVDSLGSAIVKRIQEQWISRRVANQTNLLISELGLTDKLASQLIHMLGGGHDTAYHKLRNNPYLAYLYLPFDVNFTALDRLAVNLDKTTTSINRIQAGIFYTLHRAATNGHTFLPRTNIPRYLEKYLEINPDSITELIDSGINSLENAKRIVCSGARVYLRELLEAEHRIVSILKRISKSQQDFDVPALSAVKSLLHDSLHPPLDETEFTTVSYALMHKISFIIWPRWANPLRGVYAISSLMNELIAQVVVITNDFISYKKHQKASGTTHWLHISQYPKNTDKEHTIREAAISNTSLLVIPYAEQFNLIQLHYVLAMLPESSSVCWLGDPESSSSLGPGDVFSTLVEANTSPVHKPDWPKLQHGPFSHFQNLLCCESAEINLHSLQNLANDFVLLRSSNVTHAYSLIIKLLDKGVKHLGGRHNLDFLVLTITRHSFLDLPALNKRIHSTVCPRSETDDGGFQDLPEGTPLISNTTIDSLPEGTAVRLVSCDREKHLSINVGDTNITLPANAVSKFNLAYALPYHQCLNMDVSVTFLVIPNSQSFFAHRKLFYTVASMTKQKLIVLCSQSVFFKNLTRQPKPPYSELSDIVKEQHLEFE